MLKDEIKGTFAIIKTLIEGTKKKTVSKCGKNAGKPVETQKLQYKKEALNC